MTERRVPILVKQRLSDLLLRIDAINDRDSRNLYVSELEDHLSEPLNFRRYNDARHDVWALVSACLAQPGALSALAQILCGIHGKSETMSAIDRLVADIEQTAPLTWSEQGELVAILADVPPSQAAAAYRALPDAPPADESIWLDPKSTVDHLRAVGVDDLLPLIRFTEVLAHGSAQDISTSIHTWNSELCSRTDLSRATLRAACKFGEEAQSVLPDVVTIEPNTITEAVIADDVEHEPDGADPGDENTMRTVTVVSRHVSEIELPRIWGGPVPFRNANFTGREALLHELREELTTHAKASVLLQTLQGFGGVGKTQLAIEYVHRFAEQYNLVWWISADRSTDALAGLAELGEQLGIPVNTNRQQYARTVVNALATSKYQWLLVYDNADRPDDVIPLVPSAGGHVILTSRNPEWTTRWHSIEVDVFDRKESIELLRKRDAEIRDEDADKLASKLGDLPLALEQAANFQLATGMSVDEYLELFDERVRELLLEGQPADYPETVGAFLTLAFDNLRSSTPETAELLDLFAFLGPEPVPAGLLRRGRHADLSPLLSKVLRDNLRMNKSIRELPRYGLAKVDPKGQKIQVHQLVQNVLRSVLDDERRAQTLENVRNILAAASPSEPDDKDTWSFHEEVGPHILPGDLIHSANPDARLVAIDQARYLHTRGDHAACRDLAQRMVKAWSQPPDQGGLGRDHEQTILAMRHLANAQRMLGDYADARRLDEEAFEHLRTNPAFGDDHEHTVHVALGLGFDFNVIGRFDDALRSDQENLDRAIRVYREDNHQWVLTAKSNVAGDLRLLGRFADALELSRNVRDTYRSSYGDSYHLTLHNTTELVYDLLGLGDYHSALHEQLDIWDITVHTFATHQRERLLADRNIAIALRLTGNHQAAVERAQRSSDDFLRFFGPTHEYTLGSAMTLANTLRAAGDLFTARDIADKAVRAFRKVFGDHDRNTLLAQVNFGVILRLLGERRAAHDLERTAYTQLSDLFGPEHPYTLSAATNFASSLLETQKTEQSRELTTYTLELSRRVRGDDHPDTLFCAVNAALDDLDRSSGEGTNQSTAQRKFDEVIDQLARKLGTDHPATIDAIKGKRANCDIEPPPMMLSQ